MFWVMEQSDECVVLPRKQLFAVENNRVKNESYQTFGDGYGETERGTATIRRKNAGTSRRNLSSVAAHLGVARSRGRQHWARPDGRRRIDPRNYRDRGSAGRQRNPV